MNTIVWLGAAAMALAVAGCSDAPNVTLHKPGVYKGARDPLVDTQRNPEQQEKLLARFKQVQTDR